MPLEIINVVKDRIAVIAGRPKDFPSYIKKIKGAAYDPRYKTWTYPISKKSEIIALLSHYGDDFIDQTGDEMILPLHPFSPRLNIPSSQPEPSLNILIPESEVFTTEGVSYQKIVYVLPQPGIGRRFILHLDGVDYIYIITDMEANDKFIAKPEGSSDDDRSRFVNVAGEFQVENFLSDHKIYFMAS